MVDCWEKFIKDEMEKTGDSFDNVVASTLSDSELIRNFDNGFGGSNGVPFTLWTKERVYFPVVYDGAEWVGSVSRNPDGICSGHFGGE